MAHRPLWRRSWGTSLEMEGLVMRMLMCPDTLWGGMGWVRSEERDLLGHGNMFVHGTAWVDGRSLHVLHPLSYCPHLLRHHHPLSVCHLVRETTETSCSGRAHSIR